jgi:hypothetical protein
MARNALDLALLAGKLRRSLPGLPLWIIHDNTPVEVAYGHVAVDGHTVFVQMRGALSPSPVSTQSVYESAEEAAKSLLSS